MKKIALFTTGLILAISTANAQDMVVQKEKAVKTPGPSYWSIGPTLGFGHSWMSNMSDQNFKPTANIGLAVIYSRDEHWGWGADLAASAEGYDMDYTMGSRVYNANITPVYLRLTPKAYYFFGEYGDVVRPKVYLGPSVAYKLGEDQSVSVSTWPNGDAVPRTVYPGGADVFNDFDLGVNVGAGANVRLASHTWLNLDLGYTHGLIDVTDMNNMNRNLKINAGLMFGL